MRELDVNTYLGPVYIHVDSYSYGGNDQAHASSDMDDVGSAVDFARSSFTAGMLFIWPTVQSRRLITSKTMWTKLKLREINRRRWHVAHEQR